MLTATDNQFSVHIGIIIVVDEDSSCTAILPFIFIFNTELLLIGIESLFHLLVTVSAAVVAMLTFAAATQGFFLVKSRWWETLVLLLVAFTLFRPGFWWDELFPPLQTVPGSQVVEMAEKVRPNGMMRVSVKGETLEGNLVEKTVMLPMGAAGPGAQRLQEAGLETREEEGKVFVDNVVFGSAAEKAGLDFDWQILG